VVPQEPKGLQGQVELEEEGVGEGRSLLLPPLEQEQEEPE
jgi:hypothetical protein